MSMTTQPTTGSARWLPDDPVTGNRRLRITSQTKAGPVSKEYDVEVVSLNNYRLWRLEPTTFNLICYNVVITLRAEDSWCDCPDAIRRRGGHGCKHALGLWAAINALPF